MIKLMSILKKANKTELKAVQISEYEKHFREKGARCREIGLATTLQAGRQ
jgi:hypothetical protein